MKNTKLFPLPKYEGTAEQRLLGALFLQPKILRHLETRFKTHFFVKESHRILYVSMKEVYKKYETYDPFLITSFLGIEDKKWEVCQYITELFESCPSSEHYHAYANEVVEETTRHFLDKESKLIQQELKGDKTIDEILKQHNEHLKQLQAWKVVDKKESLSDIFNDWYEFECENIDAEQNAEKPYALFGYHDIDSLLYGIREGQVHIVGARPGQGKSLFALNVAYNITKQKKKVLFCSLEMSQRQIMGRLVSMISHVPYTKSVSFSLEDKHMGAVLQQKKAIQQLPLIIKECGGMTTGDLRRYIEEEHVDVVIVDYVQLMMGEGKSMYEMITRISNELKQIAMTQHVGIIALAQLNRDAANKEPQTHNLKESGALEQDAESVLLLWRDTDPDADQTKLKVLLRKNRNGIGSADILLDIDFTTMKIKEGIPIYYSKP